MSEKTMKTHVVIKFGGTSVSTRECWEVIRRVALAHLEHARRPLVVCSALSGISDLLERILQRAPHNEHAPLMEEVLRRHQELASTMNLDANSVLAGEFDLLRRLTMGISLVGETSPRMHAEVMSLGELMSTRLGAAFLTSTGTGAAWMDARSHMISTVHDGLTDARRFFTANCDFPPDHNLRTELETRTEPIVITQGFIARDPFGRTVLLGRGGSDTSAALFAAKLEAVRCEIWTDVPGVFTANPALIPTAGLLPFLDYEEAQEIMSTGAKVLHPRCLHPVRTASIPLHIRSTREPDRQGTIISADASTFDAGVKAVSAKRGITLISMETINMWQEVGFLADVSSCFKQAGLSIDSVSTSETNVTVSLDARNNVLDDETLGRLERALSQFCKVRIFRGCALISLVGRNIRGILHKLGPVFEVFEEKIIYLVTQASNDLNLSFVVDENEADRVVRELHAQLFTPRTKSLSGTTDDDDIPETVADAARRPEEIWWKHKRTQLLELAEKHTPVYVYDGQTIDRIIGDLSRMKSIHRVLYAMKANWNSDILRRVYNAGMGFECVSPGEIRHLLNLFPDLLNTPERILFTPNFAGRQEYAFAMETGITVTLDNLYPLEHWPELFSGREVFVRLDPGVGKGHHEYVRTAGVRSKFGIVPAQMDDLLLLLKRCGAVVTGLHAHTGSGIVSAETWQGRASFLARAADEFGTVRVLDLGGGLGIPEKPGSPSLDLPSVDEHLATVRHAFPGMELWLEPGRYFVAQAGVLLARVTQTKPKGDLHYVGIDAGMNSLIRPALYGSWHEIVNLSRLTEKPCMVANIVGPICESGDTLGYNRRIAPAQEGDVLLVATAGAYGRAMSSEYNMRPVPREMFLE